LALTSVEAVAQTTYAVDVQGQFDQLSIRPDALGFWPGNSPDPTSCKHYQGMLRMQGPDGTPYLIVTRSGNIPPVPGPDDIICGENPLEDNDDPGNLLIVRMDSRDRHGERMRSNRLLPVHAFTRTPPPAEDRVVAHFTFNGVGGWPAYGHPGGMQNVGNVVAIPLEAPRQSGLPASQIVFVNFANMEQPVITSSFAPPVPAGGAAGVVGLTQLPDDSYLMLVTGGQNETIAFYKSLPTGADCSPLAISQCSNLTSPNLQWELIDTWVAEPKRIVQGPGGTTTVEDPMSPDEIYAGQNWPANPAHQTYQFIRQSVANGTLYIAAAIGRILSDDDRIELYRVECEAGPNCKGGEIRLRRVASRGLFTYPTADPDTNSYGKTASFAAASTFYVSPTGELLFYATEHDNDLVGSVKAGEWRNVFGMRGNSPTVNPTPNLQSLYTYQEGGTGLIFGAGDPPRTKAYIELFADPGYSGRSVMVDFDDWHLDDHGDFTYMDRRFTINGYVNSGSMADNASSWRWWAPGGCTIFAHDGRINSPGGRTRTLSGDGQHQVSAHLGAVRNDADSDDMNDMVASVEFGQDCSWYYDAIMEMDWDFDRDGIFERSGLILPFDATQLDGPTSLAIPVRARHPMDGASSETVAQVRIVNAVPVVGDWSVRDALGRIIGVEVPFLTANTTATAQATFSDPGRLDRQTAQINWGDGRTDLHTAFASYTDAFGGAVGNLTAARKYTTHATQKITLTITDDDGGVVTRSAVVRVLSPAMGLWEVYDLLVAAHAAVGNGPAGQAIEKACRALAGNPNDSVNTGAIARLNAGNKAAARTKIQQAIGHLQDAQAAGAPVSVARAALEQVLAAI